MTWFTFGDPKFELSLCEPGFLTAAVWQSNRTGKFWHYKEYLLGILRICYPLGEQWKAGRHVILIFQEGSMGPGTLRITEGSVSGRKTSRQTGNHWESCNNLAMNVQPVLYAQVGEGGKQVHPPEFQSAGRACLWEDFIGQVGSTHIHTGDRERKKARGEKD